MISRTLIALAAAGALAASATWRPATAAPAALQLTSPASLDLSADKDKKKDHKKGDGQGKKGGGHDAKKDGGHKGDGKKKDGGRQFKFGGDHKGDGKKKDDGKKFKFGGDHKGDGKKKDGGDKHKFGGEHKDKASAKRLRGLSHGRGQASIHGRNFSTWRGGRYRARHHDRWVTFVPLSALAAILIGGDRYYPYAYISAPEDYCEGFTEDGCRLRWREVETIDGDLIGQCVAYCPWED